MIDPFRIKTWKWSSFLEGVILNQSRLVFLPPQNRTPSWNYAIHKQEKEHFVRLLFVYAAFLCECVVVIRDNQCRYHSDYWTLRCRRTVQYAVWLTIHDDAWHGGLYTSTLPWLICPNGRVARALRRRLYYPRDLQSETRLPRVSRLTITDLASKRLTFATYYRYGMV